MLTQDNLSDLLLALGFERKGAIHRKEFGAAVLEVNVTKKEITYPEAAGLVINERQTCNFEATENFVVLECVCRLLEKGYKPEHIELEPKWKLGRGASGGRADILIKDNDGRPLLIIECKTAGGEFKRAWNKPESVTPPLAAAAKSLMRWGVWSGLILTAHHPAGELRWGIRLDTANPARTHAPVDRQAARL